MYTSKLLADLCFTKQKTKTKIFLQKLFTVFQFLKCIEVFLSINGAQSVRLEKTRIKFKNAFKEIQGPLKIYSDFKCI